MHKVGLALLVLPLVACLKEPPSTAKEKQAAQGATIAEQVIQHSGGQNAEQENIGRRLSLTMNPGQIGFIALFNQAGAPIAYYGVKGKITSSGKRLTAPVKEWNIYASNNVLGDAPSDEGTWGSSDTYVYFWTVDGQYVQWNGPYLYSDKPFRLRTEPLVIAVEAKGP